RNHGRLFYFQAEDGIRDSSVTGVQTCALPISASWRYQQSPDTGAALLTMRVTPPASCYAFSPRPEETAAGGRLAGWPQEMLSPSRELPPCRAVHDATAALRRALVILSLEKHMAARSEEHTSELQSHLNLVCR